MKRILTIFFGIILISLTTVRTKAQSTWEIKTTEIDPTNYFGITAANGMIGLVSSPKPMQVQDVVLNGAYDLYGRGRVSNILKGFNFVNMDLIVDEVRLADSEIVNFEQSLNMKEAILTTTFEIKDRVKVSYQLMALRQLPYTALIDLSFTALDNISLTPINQIEAPDHLKDVRNFFSFVISQVPEENGHLPRIPLLTSVGESPTGKHTVAASISYIEGNHEFIGDLEHEDWNYNSHMSRFRKELKKGEKLEFTVVGSIISTADVEDAHNEAERLTIYAAMEGKERLISRHKAAWDDLWQSDIVIEGNEEDQRDVRSFLYHLYSFSREGTAYSMSPMGLSGLGYNGHVFWDTELWMYPPLLMLQPEIAKSLLEYRWEKLEYAKYNAFAHGYKGAMFPWESADTGQEATPVWALTGPFQHHITADVGWAYWKYYQVTGDKQWLANRGYPMLKEVADFWTSRVERNGPGQYDIKNVIGANEWQENIDNNAYTNGVAKLVLGYATEAAGLLGIEANPDWAHVAENIPMLTFEDGTTRENATYNGEMIKQADVNLLTFPLGYYKDQPQIDKDLRYYEAKMSPKGPAMGVATLAAIHARKDDAEAAYELYRRGYKPNEVPPFGVMSETAGGTNPYFATGAGGMLLSVLGGFGGLEITNDGIQQIKQPRLPKGWKSLTMKGVGVDKKTFKVE
ncbi:MAG: glycoside hydrolase family 65 protein [Bacteroidota bacterium]